MRWSRRGWRSAPGRNPAAVFDSLSRLQTVRGRLERAAIRDNGAAIYVDFAHTPDALATALQAMRPHVMGRLLVVFGAGGDRDKGKRPLMGRPPWPMRMSSMSPTIIRAARIRRRSGPRSWRRLPQANEFGDRAMAILAAADALEPGDTLLIAGKGHESGQIVGDTVLPFDDAEQASVAVAALEGRGA